MTYHIVRTAEELEALSPDTIIETTERVRAARKALENGPTST